MKNHQSVLLGCVLSLVPLFGCTGPHAVAPQPPQSGKLLIIGGAIDEDAPAIYRALADNTSPGGVVGIIPTASGEPDASAGAAAERIGLYAPGRVAKLVRITQADTHLSNDAATAAAVAGCDALFFTGGDQQRILDVFRPGGAPTALSGAVDAVLAKGGIVAGTSAGAAMMSDPMILGGSSSRALDGAEKLPMGPGMGLFRYGIVDQHFLERGRLGRLIVAMEQSDRDMGFGISEDRALLVDRPTGRLSAMGTDSVLMVDRRGSRREGPNRMNLRISLLSSGDVIDGNSGGVTVAAARRRSDGVAELPGGSISDAWGKTAIRAAIRRIAGGARSVTLDDERFTLVLSRDGRTRVFVNPADAADVSVVGLRVDLSSRAQPASAPVGGER